MQAAKAETYPTMSRPLILPFILIGLVLGSCAPKAGVRAPLPVRGDTVRVTSGGRRAVHEFHELRGDVLVVESGDSLRRFPLASVDSLEALVGRRSRARNAVAGLGGGFLIGGGFGAVTGLVSSTSCQPDDWFCGPGFNAAAGAVVFGALGATLGLIVGTANPTTVWAPVESTALDVQADASTGGFGLRLSWRP